MWCVYKKRQTCKPAFFCSLFTDLDVPRELKPFSMAKQIKSILKNISLATASLVITLSVGISPIIVYAQETTKTEPVSEDEFSFSDFDAHLASFLNFNNIIISKTDNRVQKIEKFFKDQNMPAYKYADDFVKYADMYGLDYRLVAAISTIESTGFRNSCKKATFSGLGWGSCKINFKSYEDSIRVVSWNLAGENPKTARHYGNKSIPATLEAYNPAEIRPDYIAIVTKYMSQIAKIDTNEKIVSVKKSDNIE